MERSLSTRNSREIRGYEAADCLESKREGVSCHKSCHEMTRDIRRLEWVLREASNNMFPCTASWDRKK